MIIDPNKPEVKTAPKRVFIMIQETGKENGFEVFLGGDVQRLGKVDPKDLSPAEFWGQTLFGTSIELLRKAGVIKSETPTYRDNNDGKETAKT